MMRTVYLNIPQANTTSGKTVVLPFRDPCRLVAARVVPTSGQSDTSAVVNFGLASASNWALIADLQNVSARAVVLASWNGSATEKEKKQIFGPDTEPLDINVNINTGSELGIELIVDPFAIGSHTSLEG